ncbi:MAG TPA: cell division protein FtsW, partial [Rhabdochlamydiaceae bacterium]
MSRSQLALLLCVVLIFSMGLLMVFNTTAAEVLDRSLDRSTHHALFRQILYAVFGVAIASGFWFLGYQNV